MKITVLTLFPEYFIPLIQTSILARAHQAGLFTFETVDFRNFTKDKHGHVDDAPYGGGAGMVLKCQPILDALKTVRTKDSTVILLTPQGHPFQQRTARELSLKSHLIFICGHYEGFDERIRDYVDLQISLGDYVLTGGEPACAVICDAVLRLVDGVIKKDSSDEDSFSHGLLEYPQYTRPEIYDGKRVPEVLLSGHHANIEKWRHQMSIKNTVKHRPDLLKELEFNEEDQNYVNSLLKKDEI